MANPTPPALYLAAGRVLRCDPLHRARARAEVFPTREAAEAAGARWQATRWGAGSTFKVVATWVPVETSTEDMA